MRRLGCVIVAMLLGARRWSARMAATFIADLDRGRGRRTRPGTASVARGAARDARAAVQETNALAGEDIDRPAGRHLRADARGRLENNAATGDLDILEPLTIKGAGMGTTVIDGGGGARLRGGARRPPSRSCWSDLTIRGGDSAPRTRRSPVAVPASAVAACASCRRTSRF